MQGSTPCLSVVIPHLNQDAFLRDCLASLSKQKKPNRRIEIIVADNGSKTPPSTVCAEFEGVTLVQEATPGPGPARNAGVARSSGDFLAFIDADCTADPNWLTTVERALTENENAAVGGEVRVGYKDPDAPTDIEAYEMVYAYRNEEYVRQGYSGTGNLAMTRDVYDTVGPFAGIEVAEDQDWGLRARAAGIYTRYVPEMIIYHPGRANFTELTQKWDRHISHEFESGGRRVSLRWLAKAAALFVSPLFEIPRLATTPKLRNARERYQAWSCLRRIRWYRTRNMIAIALKRNDGAAASSWNRQGDDGSS